MIVAEASASWLQCSTISEIFKHLYPGIAKNPRDPLCVRQLFPESRYCVDCGGLSETGEQTNDNPEAKRVQRCV
jgi:hypothetical protein